MTALTLFNNTHTDIFDRIFSFDDDWGRPLVKETRDHHKPIVKDLEGKYEVSLIAPGLKKADFKITLESNHLTISYDAGDKKDSRTLSSKYSKSYTVPADCDIDKIAASYESGVMIVTLPKSESSKLRTINIK